MKRSDSNVMQWKCSNCGTVANTRSSKIISADLRVLYYQCQNIECSATFKVNASFDGFIAKPKMTTKEQALAFLSSLSEADRQEVLALSQ